MPGEYHCQPRLIEIVVDGDPAYGLRSRVDEEASTSWIMIPRGVLQQHDRGIGELLVYRRDVVEGGGNLEKGY